MKKPILKTKNGKPFFENVTRNTPFNPDFFHYPEYQGTERGEWNIAVHTNIGSITVVHRRTGYIGVIFDTETGYRDMKGKFWLASCNFDIRDHNPKTVGEAIKLIKKNANTCKGI